jgi:hypothetical protein
VCGGLMKILTDAEAFGSLPSTAVPSRLEMQCTHWEFFLPELGAVHGVNCSVICVVVSTASEQC